MYMYGSFKIHLRESKVNKLSPINAIEIRCIIAQIVCTLNKTELNIKILFLNEGSAEYLGYFSFYPEPP